MSTVELAGWIPVTVLVDVDSREVSAVQAWDEEFRYGDPPQAGAGDEQHVREEEREAREIADAAVWPAWRWGA